MSDQQPESDEQLLSYARHVGLRLRRVRKQQGLSLHAVEMATAEKFKASVLGAYERGDRVVSVSKLQGLAEFYRVPVSQLLPRPGDPGPSHGTHADEEDDAGGEASSNVTLDLIRLRETSSPERDLLGRFVRMLEVRRQDFNGRVLTVRDDDLATVGVLIDTEPELVRHRLEGLGLRV